MSNQDKEGRAAATVRVFAGGLYYNRQECTCKGIARLIPEFEEPRLKQHTFLKERDMGKKRTEKEGGHHSHVQRAKAQRGGVDRGNAAGRDIKRLIKAAERGDKQAQYQLGMCYLIGKGVKKCQAKGAKWIRKAVERSSEPEQFEAEWEIETLGAIAESMERHEWENQGFIDFASRQKKSDLPNQ